MASVGRPNEYRGIDNRAMCLPPRASSSASTVTPASSVVVSGWRRLPERRTRVGWPPYGSRDSRNSRGCPAGQGGCSREPTSTAFRITFAAAPPKPQSTWERNPNPSAGTLSVTAAALWLLPATVESAPGPMCNATYHPDHLGRRSGSWEPYPRPAGSPIHTRITSEARRSSPTTGATVSEHRCRADPEA
jgi:hypothetical protein